MTNEGTEATDVHDAIQSLTEAVEDVASKLAPDERDIMDSSRPGTVADGLWAIACSIDRLAAAITGKPAPEGD